MAPISNAQLAATAVAMARKALHARYDKTKGPLLPLGVRQEASRKDRGPPSTVWTVPVSFAAPKEADPQNAVLEAVAALGDPGAPLPPLQTADVAGEWVGWKRDRHSGAAVTAEERFSAIRQDANNGGTILFVHGGAFFQNGIGTARPTACKLAKESGARVFVVDYRLAPQSAFPSQILDLLISYLSLLYPPPGSMHGPVPHSSVVVAGESAGACIALGFLQLLLQLQTRKVSFNGSTVMVPVPAGFATVSCQADQGLCLPSWETNKDFDIFDEKAPYVEPDFPEDDIWPTTPPREEPYCPASLFHHPMVSPCTAVSWKGSPPLWFGVGQERLADSCALIAQTAFQDGVRILWDQYQSMPHCWVFLMPKFPQTVHAWKRWSKMCEEMVKGDDIQSRGMWIGIENLQESEVEIGSLVKLKPEEARDLIKAKANTRRVYYGQKLRPQL